MFCYLRKYFSPVSNNSVFLEFLLFLNKSVIDFVNSDSRTFLNFVCTLSPVGSKRPALVRI